MARLRAFATLTRPVFLLGGALLFGLGAALSPEPIDWAAYACGTGPRDRGPAIRPIRQRVLRPGGRPAGYNRPHLADRRQRSTRGRAISAGDGAPGRRHHLNGGARRRPGGGRRQPSGRPGRCRRARRQLAVFGPTGPAGRHLRRRLGGFGHRRRLDAADGGPSPGIGLQRTASSQSRSRCSCSITPC